MTHFQVPENRRQRRVNAGLVDSKNISKDVSKEEGLKIIQSYFHKQVQPTPDDPVDFPPLHAACMEHPRKITPTQNHAPFSPFEQMTGQMQELCLQKAPQPPQLASKWPAHAPARPSSQPTMSQIVAQNNAQSQVIKILRLLKLRCYFFTKYI